MTEASDAATTWVFDASAILALLQNEPGAGEVEARLLGAVICAVNLSEVVGKLMDVGMPEEEARQAVDALSLTVIPFDAPLAWQTAALRPRTRRFGLSLGDRACLATGLLLGQPVLGADKIWAELGLPLAVGLIR
ncbi:MAG: type II toxin-antitoxin system VapC family toxin [Deltaproteobacteria bacterium]|nr:type II toxin-antitoxin system VapC family toxin [Deltaproteobacteria bacterium]